MPLAQRHDHSITYKLRWPDCNACILMQCTPSVPQVYIIWSILFIVYIILIIVTAFITIALTYFQLAVEDHQ